MKANAVYSTKKDIFQCVRGQCQTLFLGVASRPSLKLNTCEMKLFCHILSDSLAQLCNIQMLPGLLTELPYLCLFNPVQSSGAGSTGQHPCETFCLS